MKTANAKTLRAQGLSVRKLEARHAALCGVWFGVFQALMPLLGYFLGVQFSSRIQVFDHWLAFFLLAAIGGNMIREARGEDEEEQNSSLAFGTMLMLAIATSIDALAVGVSLSCIKQPILFPAAVIGIVAFLFTILGLKFGVKIGAGREGKFELIGGIVLVCIGAKILVSG